MRNRCSVKRLYKNANILLPDHSVAGGVVGTDGPTISFVGSAPLDGAAWDEIVDLHGALLMPGLVNAHGHGPMTLLRGVGAGLPLQRWLDEAIFPLEAKLTAADVKAGMTWAAMEMLACGTTLVADMYEFHEAGAEALLEVGLKANLCCVGLDFPWAPGTPSGRLDSCVAFVRDFHDPAGRVVADFCLHSEYLTREPFARAIAEANADLRRPVHLHVSETAKEHEECVARHGCTPTAYFARLGVLDHGGYLAHCVYATDDDFRLMREKGASLVHNPTSNMKLGSGFARIPSALSAGVGVALGTDGCASNDNLDMFEEMHLAYLLHKGVTRDPSVLSASEAIDMATVGGARALGRHDVGAIAVGMRADFCVVSFDSPHMQPAFDVPELLVASAHGSDVVMTVVDGDILYDHGEYPTIDAGRAEFEFKWSVRRLRGMETI